MCDACHIDKELRGPKSIVTLASTASRIPM